MRIFGPNATVAQDLEPEYVGIDADGKTAYVALQENNALAVVDIKSAKVRKIIALGFKDHSVAGNEFDASNKDDAINIQSWPVLGMYMPDAIATYSVSGAKGKGKKGKGKTKTYILTANEGDSRDYDGFGEEVRIKDLEEDEGKMLDPVVFPNAADLILEENLGRLKITNTLGDANDDGFIEELYAFGARSFSIWDDKGNLVWDSGSDFEWITANLIGADFSSTNDENDSFDNRSDDKGPEPEAVTVGEIDDRFYAFIGLERVGGIMMYDITDPKAPFFVTYVNNRDFSVADVTTPEAGDLGPEGIQFVSASDSPNGQPLIIVGNEVSGTTTVYEISPTL